MTYHFKVTDEDLALIQKELETKEKIVPEFLVQAVDEEGNVCVEVKKLIYIRKKSQKE